LLYTVIQVKKSDSKVLHEKSNFLAEKEVTLECARKTASLIN